jgi:hypothetical protein
MTGRSNVGNGGKNRHRANLVGAWLPALEETPFNMVIEAKP